MCLKARITQPIASRKVNAVLLRDTPMALVGISAYLFTPYNLSHTHHTVYPATRMLEEKDELSEIMDVISAKGALTTNDDISEVLSKRRRVIGWSLVSSNRIFYLTGHSVY